MYGQLHQPQQQMLLQQGPMQQYALTPWGQQMPHLKTNQAR